VTTSPSPTSFQDLVSSLPPRIWYLTSNGADMWCRRPYGFFFSSSDAADRFVAAFGSEYGLSAIGIDARDLLSEQLLSALRGMQVTRIFLDPAIDPTSGDVFGTILRIEELN
jgi:hypothetical protein